MSSLWERELNKAWEQSFAEGRAKGMAEGMAEGKAKGRIEGMSKLLKSAMLKNHWTFAQALDRLAVSEDDRRQLLKSWPAGATV